MTPTERAEKIVKWIDEGDICKHTPDGRCWDYTKHAIAAQIEEAEREAMEMKIHSMAQECQLWYDRGFSAARQEAASIVRNEYHEAENIPGGEWLSVQIEKMDG